MVDRIAFAELHCHTQLLVPRRRVGARRPGRARGRARAVRAGRHRPPGPVRRRPVRDGGRGGRAPSGHRRRDRVASIAAVPDPGGLVVPARRRSAWRPGRRPPVAVAGRRPAVAEGRRPGPARRGPASPAIGRRSRRTCAGSARGSAGRTSCCSPATRRAIGASAGWSRGRTSPGRRRCRGSARRCSPSTPRASSRCPAAATARSRGGCGSATGRVRGRSRSGTRRCSRPERRRAAATAASSSSCTHHLLPDDDWLVAETARARRGARAAGRRDERRPLRPARGPRAARRPDRDPPRPVAATSWPTCAARTASRTSSRPPSCSRCRPASRRRDADRGAARAWARGDRSAGELAAGCSVDLGFEQLPLPGLRGPEGRDAVLATSSSCAGRAPSGATTR